MGGGGALRALVRALSPQRWPRTRPRQPPVCPPGWRVGPPDFVGVGVQRSGTTWWLTQVRAHPHVAQCGDGPKEVHFFDRFFGSDFSDEHVGEYQQFFPRPPEGISGEWTPCYMYFRWIPALLARAAPGGKVLVMLRDPVERYRSGLTYHLNRNAPAHALVAADALHRGFYQDQLSRLLQHIPRERLLVLQSEQCIRNPHQELRRTYEFLGLDADFVPPGLTRVVHPTRGDKVPMTEGVRGQLAELYQDDTTRLLASFPELDPALWPNMAPMAS